jgi:hypothetical protein
MVLRERSDAGARENDNTCATIEQRNNIFHANISPHTLTRYFLENEIDGTNTHVTFRKWFSRNIDAIRVKAYLKSVRDHLGVTSGPL